MLQTFTHVRVQVVSPMVNIWIGPWAISHQYMDPTFMNPFCAEQIFSLQFSQVPPTSIPWFNHVCIRELMSWQHMVRNYFTTTGSTLMTWWNLTSASDPESFLFSIHCIGFDGQRGQNASDRISIFISSLAYKYLILIILIILNRRYQ